MSDSHDELKADVAAYVLGVLENDARRALEAHLADCVECAAEARALREVTGALALAVPQRTPPPGLRERVLASAPGAARQGPPRGAWSLSWLPLAASLLLTLGVAAYAARLSDRVADLEARLEQATMLVSTAERARAEAQQSTVELRSAMAVLVAPDLARIDLAGQPVSPQARGRALWSRSSGMVFTASNLPALPQGRVYQVWVVTAAAPVSAGLLMPDESGRSMAVFATPPDIDAPVAVAVTIEPAGGVPAPTGDRYLIGTPVSTL